MSREIQNAMSDASNNSSGTPGLDAGATNNPDTTDLEQRLLAMRHKFQQQQADLLLQYQQKYAQLTLQHVQDSQRLVHEFLMRANLSNNPLLNENSTIRGNVVVTGSSSNVNSLLQQASDNYEYLINDNANSQLSSTSSIPPIAGHSGGKTISVTTKEKLKEMIYNKHSKHHVRGINSSYNTNPLVSAQYQPYPRLQQAFLCRDNELRKATSEPNLKIKGIQALRLKLMEKQQQNSAAQIRSNESDIITSPSLLAGANRGGATRGLTTPPAAAPTTNRNTPPAFFATPSLPNVYAGGLIDPALALKILRPAFNLALPSSPNNTNNQMAAFSSAGPPSLAALMSAMMMAASSPTTTGGHGHQRNFIPALSINPVSNLVDNATPSALTSPPPISDGGGSGFSNLPPALLADYWLAAAAALSAAKGGGGTSQTSPPTSGLNEMIFPAGSFNLLHAQIRDLVLRRKSLVKEESEDELRRELWHSTENVNSSASSNVNINVQNSRRRSGDGATGLAYDSAMCRHQCTCGDNGKHVEHGGRVQSIWARLHETGLADVCEKVLTRKSPLDYLKLCHTPSFCTFFGISPTACLKMDPQELPLKSFVQLPCGGIGVDSDTYFNDSFTPSAVRAAVGCAVELSLAIASGRLRNGFAVVRPPGHHAEPAQALGFCYFNNVAIAAKVVRQKFAGLIHKLAIVDWDVHHGNGTQIIFDSDPDVLYLSVHRHDDGNFFPGTGSAEEVGKGAGLGFTVNIPWSGEVMGDAEYLAAWRCVVEPVLDQYQPDMILVSCGFDAAAGHWNAVGGYNLSSEMFGWMTWRLGSQYARGRLSLVLEGGYNLAAISDAAECCVRRLLALAPPSVTDVETTELAGDLKVGRRNDDKSGLLNARDNRSNIEWPVEGRDSCFDQLPNDSARRTLEKVCLIQRQFWPNVDWTPSHVTYGEWLDRGGDVIEITAPCTSSGTTANTGGRLRKRFADLTVGIELKSTRGGANNGDHQQIARTGDSQQILNVSQINNNNNSSTTNSSSTCSSEDNK